MSAEGPQHEDRDLVADDVMVYGDKYGGDKVVAYIAVAGAVSLGPFVTAFCTELGKRLGGNVADRASRVSIRRRRRSSDDAELVVAMGDVETVIEVDEGWSDDAKLALLDLDPTAAEVRGQRLRWDSEARAWLPSEEIRRAGGG